jgi:hypothetical protein
MTGLNGYKSTKGVLMTWFERLTGFAETSPDVVRRQLTVTGDQLTSLVNGRVMVYGRLEIPTLADLRQRLPSAPPQPGKLALREIVANVQALHADPANAGALFQVASQFNLLEMASPAVTPEAGVGIYEQDHTQGPACAVAAGAGTIYRNYFVPLNGQRGQTAARQLDCLADLGQALGNEDGRLWRMQNGYALATETGLREVALRLQQADEQQRDELRQRLRIGLQWQTQVTLNQCSHQVSQAYCAALPVAYTSHPPAMWAPFARLVLEAAYEATLSAAVGNWLDSGHNRLFLTLLGGGVFGNEISWILASLARALRRYETWPLDVAIVSYGRSRPEVQQFINHST